MNKSQIRNKTLKIRKKLFDKDLKIDSNKFISFLKKKKLNLKIFGGYYPSNYEIDDLDVLNLLGKKVLKMDFIKGYAINRILVFQLHEAIKIVIKNKINKKNLDEIYIHAIGTVNGPLKTADIIGLDILDKMFDEILGNEYDIGVRTHLNEYISKGFLGRKKGRGFYEYPKL